MSERPKLAECETDEYINDFIDKNSKYVDSKTCLEKLVPFIEVQKSKNRKIVLLTSGRTVVPLEKNTVRHISNFSSGTRGMKSSIEFLKLGYGVILLHHRSARLPFTKSFTLGSDLVSKDDDIVVSESNNEELKDLIKLKEETKDRYIEIRFDTLFEYLLFLSEFCQALNIMGPRAMLYAAAAVSDFYLPYEKMSQHKIQSREHGGLTIELVNTPKFLKPIKTTWSPKMFLCSFKLETDEKIIKKKVSGAQKKYKSDLVVSNLRQTHRNKVKLHIGDNEPKNVDWNESMEAKCIEELFIKEISDAHDEFIKMIEQ